jgi:type IV pilus assembly protein PilW
MNKKCIVSKCKLKNQSGVTLIELMIALAIGAILLVGLATVFINSSTSRRELEKSSALIENGRYAISMIAEDLSLAGYYGFFNRIGDPLAALPDPCALTEANIMAAMAQPLQGYRAANLTTIPDINTTNSCEAALLTPANLTQGSDILILRRADTAVAGAMSAKEVYIEQNLRTAAILIDDAATGLLRSPSKPGSPAADIRKYHTHVYFVAPCSRGSGGNGVCQGGDDNIPTLKRLSLGADSTNANTIMEIEPLIEGIEYMKLEYGIDTVPTTANALTGEIGDGIPDSYTTSPGAATQWANVVSVQVFLLARSPQATDGHMDTKSYVLGSTNIPAANDQFKRHVYSAEVRPTNIAGRREIPQ